MHWLATSRQCTTKVRERKRKCSPHDETYEKRMIAADRRSTSQFLSPEVPDVWPRSECVCIDEQVEFLLQNLTDIQDVRLPREPSECVSPRDLLQKLLLLMYFFNITAVVTMFSANVRTPWKLATTMYTVQLLCIAGTYCNPKVNPVKGMGRILLVNIYIRSDLQRRVQKPCTDVATWKVLNIKQIVSALIAKQ